MIRGITRLSTTLVALGVGVAAFPAQWRKSSGIDNKLTHINSEVAERLENTSEFQRLEADPNTEKHYSSHVMPEQHRENYVSTGLFFGRQLHELDPIVFLNKKDREMTAFYHLGDKLVAADGKIHNGVVSTILDEGLCRCGFPFLPSGRGVTAKLSLNFRNEAPPQSTLVLRAKVTETKGRKVVINGSVETFPFDGSTPSNVVADATCILVEPKWFKYFSWAQLL
ncbi:Piso0_004481 [Millerozyma farinosa CBS 7064]|uniref:Piso0_004481 protein n=2 Tax=Millerozyma farinosa TaxID=4920 RepID=G8Y8X1_PICSO|nr:Piso0_004481 [Millerozyma farinosa CBS 7064]CCE84916.1 Piso0_004481 [Millerozyma farinosa CBS 7064]